MERPKRSTQNKLPSRFEEYELKDTSSTQKPPKRKSKNHEDKGPAKKKKTVSDKRLVTKMRPIARKEADTNLQNLESSFTDRLQKSPYAATLTTITASTVKNLGKEGTYYEASTVSSRQSHSNDSDSGAEHSLNLLDTSSSGSTNSLSENIEKSEKDAQRSSAAYSNALTVDASIGKAGSDRFRMQLPKSAVATSFAIKNLGKEGTYYEASTVSSRQSHSNDSDSGAEHSLNLLDTSSSGSTNSLSENIEKSEKDAQRSSATYSNALTANAIIGKAGSDRSSQSHSNGSDTQAGEFLDFLGTQTTDSTDNVSAFIENPQNDEQRSSAGNSNALTADASIGKAGSERFRVSTSIQLSKSAVATSSAIKVLQKDGIFHQAGPGPSSQLHSNGTAGLSEDFSASLSQASLNRVPKYTPISLSQTDIIVSPIDVVPDAMRQYSEDDYIDVLDNKKNLIFRLLERYRDRAYEAHTFPAVVKNLLLSFLTPATVLRVPHIADKDKKAIKQLVWMMIYRDHTDTKESVLHVISKGESDRRKKNNKKNKKDASQESPRDNADSSNEDETPSKPDRSTENKVNTSASCKTPQERRNYFAKIVRSKGFQKMISEAFKHFRDDVKNSERRKLARQATKKNKLEAEQL